MEETISDKIFLILSHLGLLIFWYLSALYLFGQVGEDRAARMLVMGLTAACYAIPAYTITFYRRVSKIGWQTASELELEAKQLGLRN